MGFWGALPLELKGMEFVYRVPLMTHVSDFQSRVLQLIHPLVSDPSKVRIVFPVARVFLIVWGRREGGGAGCRHAVAEIVWSRLFFSHTRCVLHFKCVR